MSHRDRILVEGLKLVQERGFGGASVRDIVQAAGVPQGSFTNHFSSKEAFTLEILDIYSDRIAELTRGTLLNDALSPLKRLFAFIDANNVCTGSKGMRTGCLLGNFSAERADHSEPIRRRLVELFAVQHEALTRCLMAAVVVGELPPETDCADVAALTLSSLQGALLLGKARRSNIPVEQLKRALLQLVLH